MQQRYDADLPRWADPEVAEGDLDPQGVSRRGLMRRAGLFGVGFAAAAVVGEIDPAAAGGPDRSAPCGAGAVSHAARRTRPRPARGDQWAMSTTTRVGLARSITRYPVRWCVVMKADTVPLS